MMKNKKLSMLVAPMLALSLFATACGETPSVTDSDPKTETTEENEAQTPPKESAPAESAQEDENQPPSVFEARVDVVPTENGDAYFYVPTASKLLSVRTCTTPILVVMGDSDFTEETVPEAAEASGIAQIANEEGAIAVFLNSKGDTWTDDDVATYTSIFTSFSDDSNTEYTQGKSADGIYAGSLQRIYVFAEGSAADFVAEHFNNQLDCFVDYGMYQLNNDVTPAYTAMFQPTVNMPNTTEYPHDIPMAAINPADTAQAKDALGALVPVTKSSYVGEGGFDSATVMEIYHSHMSALRRQSGVIVPIPNLDALGMIETVVPRTTENGTIECYEYASKSFSEADADSVPLVFLFHGGGNHAQYFAWASGWIDIAAADNLFLVSLDKHVAFTSADVIELLGQLQEEYPQIDSSRIYATGFSMGAVKCWNLAIKYPEYFAGIMPCDAGYMSENSNAGGLEGIAIEDEIPVSETIIPIFYVAGGQSFTHEDVTLEEGGGMNNVGVILQRIFAMNQVDSNYFYDETKNANWGIEAADTETVHNATFDNDMEISSIASQDGTVYTKLCFDVEKGHESYVLDGLEAWKFIKQFTRNENSSITIQSF